MPWAQRPPQTPEEEAVRDAGYPWFQTNILRKSDRLGAHLHHSCNTHRIVQGKLIITVTSSNTTTTLTPDETQTLTIGRCEEYEGMAGPEGAQFVEGHQALSPATAKRFKQQGTIWWTTDMSSGTEQEWFTQTQSEYDM